MALTVKVNVEYLKDHGNHKQGDKSVMYKGTATALAKHKIVKVGAELKKGPKGDPNKPKGAK